MHQYFANRKVFRNCLKLPPITGFRKLSGREFQTDGPATQKARRPRELSGWRGTTRSCRVADWRIGDCCRDATPATRLAQFHEVRRRLTVQAVEHHGAELVHDSLRNIQPMYSSVWRRRDKPRSNLWVPLTTRAAAFNTRCNLLVVAFGAPARTALQ